MRKTSSADNAALRALPARTIVRAIAGAAERWADADFPPRVRATAAIEERLGYTTPVVDYALDRLFRGITADALMAAITGELGSLDILDGFAERAGRPAAWARGADAVTIVSSDTTIGVAIVPLVFALAAKCAVTVKDRSDALVAAFVETLGEERAELRAATDVRAWSGGDDDIEVQTLGDADVVVAFGGDQALRSIRARCAVDATFVPFGHRASAGYVTAAALAGDARSLAAGAARDALLYDGDGCLSLHLLFVERTPDGAHERFVDALAEACSANAVEFPAGPRKPARAARIGAYAAAAAFRAANGSGRVLRAPDGTWTVVADPPAGELPPFGGGVIPVIFVDGVAGAVAYVERHALPLQALGVADVDDPSALAERLGAVRIARLGQMQDPPPAGHHGGRARIADFIRWIDRA
jgi:Acyl-CoA reductase (LuxC)